MAAPAGSQPQPAQKAQLIQFSDDLYFSSQPSVAQLENLNLMGLKSVVNMRCTDEAGFLPQEEKLLDGQGIKYAQIGVQTANDIDAAYTAKVLEKIEELPKPVLVHCAVGLTAAMISCIRVAKANGASGKDVLASQGMDLGYNFANQAKFYQFVMEYLPETEPVKAGAST